jgi:hypothetical protein
MIKSNILKTVPYPDDFNDEDKLEYDTLYAQAQVLHAKTAQEEPFIIHTAIIGHIRAKKGMEMPYTDEELQAVKNSYMLKSKVVECKKEEIDPYLYDEEKNPMYFPSKLIISSDEINSNVIIESKANNE